MWGHGDVCQLPQQVPVCHSHQSRFQGFGKELKSTLSPQEYVSTGAVYTCMGGCGVQAMFT